MCSFPDIISFQHTRSTLRHMIKQKFGNGMWIGLTTGVCPGCLSYFHFVPFVFLIMLVIFSAFAGLGYVYPLLYTGLAYLMFDFVNTVICFLTKRVKLQFLLLPILFPILHLAYGAGTFCGLVKMPFWRKKLGKAPFDRINEVKEAVIKNNRQNKKESSEV